MRQSMISSCFEPIEAGDSGHDEGADAMPNGSRGQLLRSDFPIIELATDTNQYSLGFFSLAMHGGDGEMNLTSMSGELPDTREQERAAGDRLQACLGMGQAHKQAPPVVGQRHRHGSELATLQIMGGKAAPAPLVLQLIKGVLGIAPISVKLRDGAELMRQVGDQHCVLVALDRFAFLDES